MFNVFKRVLGYVWASPVTAAGLLYALSFHALSWYRWKGVEGDALVWEIDNDKLPAFLKRSWQEWAGHTIGNVVVLNETYSAEPSLLQHELVHVRQCMRLGIFQPILYVINYLSIKIGCPDAHPYFDNSFEIEARRATGQTIDVLGIMRKIKSSKKDNT
jgi:hypothetical protein